MFIIILDDPNEVQKNLIETHYPNSKKLATNAFLVKADQVSQTVAENVGIRTDPTKGAGVVLGLNGAYSGFTAPSVWEWFKNMQV